MTSTGFPARRRVVLVVMWIGLFSGAAPAAAVVVVTVSGADLRQVADRYRTRFADATDAQPLIQDEPATFAAVSATPPAPCPAGGGHTSR